jgi:hypothetical protein
MGPPGEFTTICYYFPPCGQNIQSERGVVKKIIPQNRLFSTIFREVTEIAE